jgi:RNA polymerase sigma-70 factor (ECF subfamily)
MDQHQKQAQFQKEYPILIDTVYRYVLYRVPYRADCEDIVSETFLTAYRNLKQYAADKGTLEQWLKGVAKREIVRYWRSYKLTIDIEDTMLLLEAVDLETQPEQLDRKLLFERMMQSLPEEMRSILALHYIDGLTYEEIAELTDKKPATIRQFFSRLHRNLRQQFKHYYIIY